MPLSGDVADGLPDRSCRRRHGDLQPSGLGAELDADAFAARRAIGDGGVELLGERSRTIARAAGTLEGTADKLGQHLAGRVAGQRQRKEEFVGSHRAGFYSESRSKSTRARSLSAAICSRSAARESKARSSRSRCTKPIRSGEP